jgi:hypothetical protein
MDLLSGKRDERDSERDIEEVRERGGGMDRV